MDQAKGEDLLRRMLGESSSFRNGQWEAIEAAAVLKQRVLVVQRTGWGKSIVYFIATKILRDRGSGPALLISPLLALMRNQIGAARNLGLRAITIHSENVDEWDQAKAAITRDECDILLISPERLANTDFRREVITAFRNGVGLFVVDEAHCISDWGHDFRPDYRRIVRILERLPSTVPVLCTTATANNRVVEDIVAQIPHLQVQRGPLTRVSLKLYNIRLSDQAERLAWLSHFIPALPGSGIVYCLTIADTARVASWLQSKGIDAFEYHSEIDPAQRVELERRLLENHCKVLVATVALGMGFDKPDLGFVIHFQRPGSVIAYYQQVGRAGRAVDDAYGILLNGREDDEIQDYFIRSAFPSSDAMEQVLSILDRTSSASVSELMDQLNFRRGLIEKCLKLLEVDEAVVKEGTKYFRTPNPWNASSLNSKAVTENRLYELDQIRHYVNHEGCLMEFLARALDDPSPKACGKCMNCLNRSSRHEVPETIVKEASEFLKQSAIELRPRKQWPSAVLAQLNDVMSQAIGRRADGHLKVSIPALVQIEYGRALSM